MADGRNAGAGVVFTLGCLTPAVMMIWLGLDGFAPGFVLYAIGWALAMALQDS